MIDERTYHDKQLSNFDISDKRHRKVDSHTPGEIAVGLALLLSTVTTVHIVRCGDASCDTFKAGHGM